MINKVIFIVLTLISIAFNLKFKAIASSNVDIISPTSSETVDISATTETVVADSIGITNKSDGVITPEPTTKPPISPAREEKREPSNILALEQIYLSQVGVREKTGNNDGPEVEAYLKTVKLGKGNAWCAAFVRWCLLQAGIKNSITGWSPTAVNSKNIVYRDRKYNREPRAGDVVTFYYPHLNRIGHTGFYHKKISGAVYQSVEGNTNGAGSREGDGVYLKNRPINTTYIISRWD